MTEPGTDYVALHRSEQPDEGRQVTLVLQAVGIPFEVRHDGQHWLVLVASADAERARTELDAYVAENRLDPAPIEEPVQSTDGWSGVLAYGTLIGLIGVLAQRRVFEWDWYTAGRTQAGLILQGEWWRTVTALTLHADPVHFLANLIFGGWIGLYAGRTLGSGVGWCIALVAGAVGNFVNALVHPPEHASIGASTAIFAALGLLAAHHWRRKKTRLLGRMERWAPVAAGLTLLSFLGSGGERTDVFAHLFGFLCGLGAGAITGGLPPYVFGPRNQRRFGVAIIALVVLSWMLAFLRQSNVL